MKIVNANDIVIIELIILIIMPLLILQGPNFHNSHCLIIHLFMWLAGANYRSLSLTISYQCFPPRLPLVLL